MSRGSGLLLHPSPLWEGPQEALGAPWASVCLVASRPRVRACQAPSVAWDFEQLFASCFLPFQNDILALVPLVFSQKAESVSSQMQTDVLLL